MISANELNSALDEVKRSRGRPSKITPEKIDLICALVARGSYLETAAVAIGISKSTFYDWLRTGAARRDEMPEPFDRTNNENPEWSARFERLTEREQLCMELSTRLEIALAQADVRDLDRIDEAASGGVWQAAAWRLQHRSAHYGRARPAAGASHALVQTGVDLPESSPGVGGQLLLPASLSPDAFEAVRTQLEQEGSLPGVGEDG